MSAKGRQWGGDRCEQCGEIHQPVGILDAGCPSVPLLHRHLDGPRMSMTPETHPHLHDGREPRFTPGQNAIRFPSEFVDAMCAESERRVEESDAELDRFIERRSRLRERNIALAFLTAGMLLGLTVAWIVR